MKRFQIRHGIQPDGRIGKATLRRSASEFVNCSWCWSDGAGSRIHSRGHRSW